MTSPEWLRDLVDENYNAHPDTIADKVWAEIGTRLDDLTRRAWDPFYVNTIRHALRRTPRAGGDQ